MKSCGLIVEYNPFHNGHLFHAKKARELTNADCVIAIMSGNFTQRGEVAMVDKWKRAEMALRSGAVDLILELPPVHAVQSSDYFAMGGVAIASKMKCSSLVFGTDSSTSVDYEAYGKVFQEKKEEIKEKLQKYPHPSDSYPVKMTKIVQSLLPGFPLDDVSPNHILGMSYAKANAELESPMHLVAIPRVGNEYLQTDLSGTFSSATAIRKAVFAGEVTVEGLPDTSIQVLEESVLSSWEDYFPLLPYKILSSTKEELSRIYQMTEGLEVRFLEKIQTSDSFESFLSQLQTKRYTKNRLRRLCCYVLWNITQSEVDVSRKSEKVVVLGMNEKGKAYLHQNKSSFSSFLLSSIGKREEGVELQNRVDSIFRLGNEKQEEQTKGRFPIIAQTLHR